MSKARITLELDGERYGVEADAPNPAFTTVSGIETFTNKVATLVARTIMSHYAATLAEDVVD